LHLAKKQLLKEELNLPSAEIDKISQYLDETMKILGCEHESLTEIFAEIQGNQMLKQLLAGRIVKQSSIPKEVPSPVKRRVASSHLGR
jgi:hypothetical protein